VSVGRWGDGGHLGGLREDTGGDLEGGREGGREGGTSVKFVGKSRSAAEREGGREGGRTLSPSTLITGPGGPINLISNWLRVLGSRGKEGGSEGGMERKRTYLVTKHAHHGASRANELDSQLLKSVGQTRIFRGMSPARPDGIHSLTLSHLDDEVHVGVVVFVGATGDLRGREGGREGEVVRNEEREEGRK